MTAIVPYPGDPNYGVTRDGRVFRIVRSVRGRPVPFELKQQLGANGYLYVGGSNSPLGCRTVHRMIAETFLANPKELPEVAHNNGERGDCAASNLRWATRIENFADRITHGTDWRGEKHRNAKLTTADVLAIRGSRAPCAQIASIFGISASHVSYVRNRRGWTHV